MSYYRKLWDIFWWTARF